MSDRKIKVVNMSNATVTLSFKNSNFKRTLRGEGANIDIPFNTFYDGLSEPGVEFMITQGYIAIPDKQDRIDLGLEHEDDEQDLSTITMSSKEMLDLLKEGNPVNIKASLEKLSKPQQKKMAEVAIQNGIYSPGIAAIIKKFTGIDLASAIADEEEISE